MWALCVWCGMCGFEAPFPFFSLSFFSFSLSNFCRFKHLYQGFLTTWGGIAGIGLGRLLEGEHASTS